MHYNPFYKLLSSNICWRRSKVIDTLLDELQDHNHSKTTRLVYFYCNRAEKTRSDPESILSALVQQLARSPLGILKPVVDLYMDRKEEGQRTSRLTMQETQTLLVELTDMYPQTIICIDALDEVNSESRIILLKSLKSVIDKSKNLVKIFAASRNDPDIVLQFSIFPRIDVQPDDNASDIHKFIISRMKTVIADQRLLFGRVSNELASEICDTLCTRSTGM